MQLRDKKKNIFFPGFWGIFGGNIKLKESPSKAITRELGEEINLNFRTPIKKLRLDIYSELFNPKRKRTFYICKPKKIPKKIKIKKVKKFGLFSYNQLKKLRVVPFDFSAISYHYFRNKKDTDINKNKSTN